MGTSGRHFTPKKKSEVSSLWLISSTYGENLPTYGLDLCYP